MVARQSGLLKTEIVNKSATGLNHFQSSSESHLTNSNLNSNSTLHSSLTVSRRPVIIIGLYNYKGGVGKTTNLIQIASTLARAGHRILMVDADPQCNLTSFYKPRTDEIRDGNENNDDFDDTDMEDDNVDSE